VIKLPAQTADDRFVSRICEAQAAAGEAAQMLIRADNDHGFAHARRLHRRHHAGAGAAINNQVGLMNRRGRLSGDRQSCHEQPKYLFPHRVLFRAVSERVVICGPRNHDKQWPATRPMSL